MDLEQRVVELERRTTRYRNAMVLLVVGICAVAVVGATTDDGVIRGRELRLSNGAGQDVFVAKADSTGGDGMFGILLGSGEVVVYGGTSTKGNGNLMVSSKAGTDLIYAGASDRGNGLREGARLALRLGRRPGGLFVGGQEGRDLASGLACELVRRLCSSESGRRERVVERRRRWLRPHSLRSRDRERDGRAELEPRV